MPFRRVAEVRELSDGGAAACSPTLTSENSWPPERFEARRFTAETVSSGRSGVTDLRWQGASVLSDQGYTLRGD